MVTQGTANPYNAGSSPVRCSIINLFIATLAQLVEQLICNHQVVGSIPTGGSIFMSGYSAVWLAHSLWERRVAGSNPAIPTMSTSSSQVRTPGFHPGNRSSNLRVDAILNVGEMAEWLKATVC